MVIGLWAEGLHTVSGCFFGSVRGVSREASDGNWRPRAEPLILVNEPRDVQTAPGSA